MTSPTKKKRTRAKKKQNTTSILDALRKKISGMTPAEAIAEGKRIGKHVELMEQIARMAQADARRNLTSIARDLLPQAAGYARKGRPRLLAVCAKIIGDPKLKPFLP